MSSTSSRRKTASKDTEEKENEEMTENAEVEEESNDNVAESADGDTMMDSMESVDKLVAFGINQSDIKKLKEGNIHTISALAMTTRKRLMDLKGLSEVKADKLLTIALSNMKSHGFQHATQVHIRQQQKVKISTGSTVFDEMLGGGIESGYITEAFGEFRTGKTQIAHTLAVSAQAAGHGNVLYIDTEGTFRADRIISISEKFGVNAEDTLDGIIHVRVFNHEMQMKFLIDAAALMVQTKFALIIVDSATALFRVDFCGRGQLSERQQKLGAFLSVLTKMAEEFSVAVYLTNQVVSDPQGNAMGFVAHAKPIGGNIMAHSCHLRLHLRKGKAEQRIVKIYDSPNLPESECVYQITEGGIADATD